MAWMAESDESIQAAIPEFRKRAVELEQSGDHVGCRCNQRIAYYLQELLDEWDILAGYELGRDYPELADGLLVCVTEMNSREEIDTLVAALAEVGA